MSKAVGKKRKRPVDTTDADLEAEAELAYKEFQWDNSDDEVDNRTGDGADGGEGERAPKRARHGAFEPRLLPPNLFDDDAPGERWAVHPDFPPTELLVSNLGYVRTRGLMWSSAEGLYHDKDLGHLQSCGYRRKQIGRNSYYKVHLLVCEAFHGPRPGPDYTVDHVAKYGTDFVRERSDNRASNLRWATRSTQITNQVVRRPKSIGVPVYGRLVGSTNEADWHWYSSAHAAGVALGLSGSTVGKCCKQPSTNTKGYEFRYAPATEPQTCLPAEERGPAHARFSVCAERWLVAPNSNGRLRVSSRGRVQTQVTRGDNFGPMRTPKPVRGAVYAHIKHGGREKLLHAVVWLTFRPDRPLVGDETIDHVDRDETNNALYNLRPLSRSGQVCNQTRPTANDQNRLRIAVCGWVWGQKAETFQRFTCIKEAARTLNARCDTNKFGAGNISHCVKGTRQSTNGWCFEAATTANEKDRREVQRQRVLAAIAALPNNRAHT